VGWLNQSNGEIKLPLPDTYPPIVAVCASDGPLLRLHIIINTPCHKPHQLTTFGLVLMNSSLSELLVQDNNRKLNSTVTDVLF